MSSTFGPNSFIFPIGLRRSTITPVTRAAGKPEVHIRFLTALLLLSFSSTDAVTAQEHGIKGTWKEPGGAVITIAPCGADLCARLVHLPTAAPPLDVNNPDHSLRDRPLCGLSIGQGFHLSDPEHANGGKLYDPKSGKTYSGSMVSSGDELRLRGYIGFKAFGRTETWQRTAAVPACSH